MKSPYQPRLRSCLALLGLTAFAPPAFAGNFLYNDSGPYEYTNTENWAGGTINNIWNSTLSANQTIFFGADTTLSSTLSITNNSASFNHTFISSGGDHTLTLGGSVALFGSNANKVTIGSTNQGERLNINLGNASRKFEPNANRTLEIINVISGSGTAGINKEGSGTLRLLNVANTFTGSISFLNASGVIEVTKLANSGEDSSIGKGTGAISFGGSTAGTLRYIGTGDSTNRAFTVGGAGATFDASGSGAVKWTNTASVANYSNAADRTITFKGTNSGDNTMSASFGTDTGVGKTNFKKEGAGTWILAGNNINTGTTLVAEGTLATGTTGTFGAGNVTVATGAFLTAGNASSFADTATLTFSSNSLAGSISLSAGTDIIGAVYDSISASYMGAGTHDAAALNEFFHTSVFTGPGSLTISAVPEPSSFALLAGAGGLLLAAARRRRNPVAA